MGRKRKQDKVSAIMVKKLQKAIAEEDPTHKEVSAIVRAAMEERGMSIYRLSLLTGVSQASIRSILLGLNSPTLSTLCRLLVPLRLRLKLVEDDLSADN